MQNVKNMDFCIGTPCYWLIGFGLMFGFNGGSSLSLSTDETMTLTGLVCFNTNLAAAVSTCVTMLFTWKRYGKPDVSMTLNGSLAGLVAITAGCDTVSPFGAFIIGFVAGILVVLSVEFFDNIAKIDARNPCWRKL